MATSDIPFASIAEVMDEVYQEAAIVLPGPPIQIFAQRAAPTIVLKSMKQHCGKVYYECKALTGEHPLLPKYDSLISRLISEC